MIKIILMLILGLVGFVAACYGIVIVYHFTLILIALPFKIIGFVLNKLLNGAVSVAYAADKDELPLLKPEISHVVNKRRLWNRDFPVESGDELYSAEHDKKIRVA